MKNYFSSSARKAVKIVLVAAILLPINITAQRSKKSASELTLPQQVSQVQFTSGSSALKIPLEIDNNIILMRVSINNSKPLRLIFDTGASISVINSRRATELGLKSKGEAHGNATGGKIKGTYATGVSLSVPGAKVSNQVIALIPFNTPPGFDFDGAIGCDFIRQFVVEIDYQTKTMNLYDPKTYTYSGKGEVIRLILAKGKTPLVRTKIVLEERSIPLEANLEVDTGEDSTFLINSPLVKKEKLVENFSKTTQSNAVGAGGEQKRLIGRVKSVQFGRVIINNPPVGLSQDTEGSGASKENDGIIGGEVFRRFKIILDYSRKRMILEPNSSFNDPYDVDTDSILPRTGKNNYEAYFNRKSFHLIHKKLILSLN